MQWIWWLLAIDLALRVTVRSWPGVKPDRYNITCRRGVFVLPGVLADAKNQVTPIREELFQLGDLYYCKYGLLGGRVIYSPSVVKRLLARKILRQARANHLGEIILCAISLGGTVALDVAAELRRLAPDEFDIKLLALESVSGSENLLSGGNVVAPIMRWARFIPSGLILGTVLGVVIAIPQALWFNQLPKESEIEDDIVIKGVAYSKAAIQRKAKHDMAGYLIGVLFRELAHMSSSQLDASRLACFSKIVYIEYTLHNVTVSQPAERNKWQAVAAKAGVPFTYWQVESPHVALWQMPTASRKALSQAVSELL